MGYESEERTLEMMMTMEMRWSHSPLVVGTTRCALPPIPGLDFAANSNGKKEAAQRRMLRPSQLSLLLPSLLLVRGAVHAGYA